MTMMAAMAKMDGFLVFSMKMTKIERATCISLQKALPSDLKFNRDVPQDILVVLIKRHQQRSRGVGGFRRAVVK